MLASCVIPGHCRVLRTAIASAVPAAMADFPFYLCLFAYIVATMPIPPPGRPAHGYSQMTPAKAASLPTESLTNAGAAPEAALAADMAAILTSIGEAAYEWHIESDVLRWSPNAGTVLNIADPALIATGRAYAHLLAAENAQSRFEAVMNSPSRDNNGAGVRYQAQYALRGGADDTPLWVEDTGCWFAGPDSRPARAQGTIRVINERRVQEERLSYLSRFDELTCELNRWNLIATLDGVLQDAIKFRTSFGFLVVSVDDLARINEAYGFAVGDEVISAFARRLRAKMRGGDSLGRLSGNKFGVILKECGPDDLVTAADRFLVAVRDDVIQTSSGPVAVTASVGGIVAPRHGQTVHDVLSRAHEALHIGKHKRPGSVEVFRPNMEREALRRENMRASDEIIGALNERRMLPAFEPVVEAALRRPAFHECLMRIRRADGTLIAASEIMPIAERLGLVRLIDHRMLELAVAELAATPDLQLSLNVSPASTNDGTWWNALAALLAGQPGLAPRLMIEITESAAIQDIDEARGFVTRVKGLGCRIAIDDFGAGYTSFRNMRTLGVDLVKIDGSFVTNMATSSDDRAFVRMLIELARQLGLKTVAEWVQDERSAAMLTEWGCDYLQGALIGSANVVTPWGAAAASAAQLPPANAS
jgi:diguanylate cyclase (GGDEF)-like protein